MPNLPATQMYNLIILFVFGFIGYICGLVFWAIVSGVVEVISDAMDKSPIIERTVAIILTILLMSAIFAGLAFVGWLCENIV